MGAFLDGEWDSLIDIFKFESPNFGAQILNNDFSIDHIHNSNNNNNNNNNNECFFYDSSSISEIFSHNASYNNITSSNIPNSDENCHFYLQNDVILPMNNNIITMMGQENHANFDSGFRAGLDFKGPKSTQVGPIKEDESENDGSPPLNREVQVKRKCNAPEVETEHKVKNVLKKKARLSKDKSKNSIIESKKTSKVDEGEKGNSGDESKFCEQKSEVNMSTSNKEVISETSKTKKRASRGTATDPQSLYARRRRERINERLRILQNLVPNGTKVDISTMLEEAVHYVKFLQLQIQLLSSDELWMYAPIAYNGVDISLYKRISPFLLP